MDKRVSIRIESHRHRLCDPGGISEKAAIDGLVNAGILRDDSTKEIQEPIIHTQKYVRATEPEITIITIEDGSLRYCPFMYWQAYCQCKYHDSASMCTIDIDAERDDAWCHIMIEKGMYASQPDV